MASVENLADELKISLFGEMSADLIRIREKLNKLKESLAAEMGFENETKKETANLEEQLDNTSKEIAVLQETEQFYKLRLDAVKNGNEEYFNDLHNLGRVYGWQITEYNTLENKHQQITMHYNKSKCFVKFIKNESFDLLEVYPAHPSFKLIKKLLQDTKDLPLLLRFFQKSFNTSASAPNA